MWTVTRSVAINIMAERVDPVAQASNKSPVFDTKQAGDDGLRRADGISGLCMFPLVRLSGG